VTPSNRLPKVGLHIVPNPYSKSGGNTLLVSARAYRSKWVTLTCFCKRARKDGTCKTLDQVKLAPRVKVEHKFPASTRGRMAAPSTNPPGGSPSRSDGTTE
jgi:hypothetical protein